MHDVSSRPTQELLTELVGRRTAMTLHKESLRSLFGVGEPPGRYGRQAARGLRKLLVAKELVTRALAEELPSRQAFSGPASVQDYLHLTLGHLEREVFACIYVDTRHRLIRFEVLFYGTIDATTVHPREVVKAVLALNAAAVIFVHNHPSGVAEPSSADQALTRRLSEALALIDVRVLDHFVVGGRAIVSFTERGLL